MNERPWWFYGLQIVGLALLIPGLLVAHMHSISWSTDLSWSINSLTVGLALMGFGILATVIALLRWLLDRHVGLWGFFGDFW